MIGTAGNVSERAGELVAITPTGAVLDELDPDEVTVVDLDGERRRRRAGARRRSSTCTSASTARYGAGAVVHTHAPMATALSLRARRAARACTTRCSLLGGPVRVAPYATFGTPELAEVGARRARRPHRRADGQPRRDRLGADLDAARRAALLLEWACTVYWRAAALGTPRVLDEAAAPASSRRRSPAATGRPGRRGGRAR